MSALPLSAACTLAPTAPLRPVVFSWHCAPAADVGFFVAVVVCVAIVKWSQCAAPVCTCVSFCCLCGHCKVVTGCSSCLSDRQACVRLGSLSIPSCSTEAAFVAPSLPGMFQDLSTTVLQPACGPSCCGADFLAAALHSVVLVGHWLSAGARSFPSAFSGWG